MDYTNLVMTNQTNNIYEVIVGNIGTTTSTPDYKTALRDFIAYKTNSENGVGREAGENVTLMKDGEILEEYFGALSCEDTCGDDESEVSMYKGIGEEPIPEFYYFNKP